MSAIAAAQWTAIATIALAVLAIVTAIFAYLAFRSQAQAAHQLAEDLKTRQDQLAGQQELIQIQSVQLRESLQNVEREAAERRAAQAKRVLVSETRGPDPAAGPDRGPRTEAVAIKIANTSDLPIRDLTISWHKGTAPWGDRQQTHALMPGADSTWTRALPDDLPSAVDRNLFSAVVYFQDANRLYWRAGPNGELEEIPPGREPQPA